MPERNFPPSWSVGELDSCSVVKDANGQALAYMYFEKELVADVGAGTGYFSVRIAKRIPEGKIFAADIEPDMVRYLGERARREHLINLVPVQASADAANLPEPVDVAIVVDTYHHIGNRTQYFAQRPAGRLVIVDFKVDSPNGPPVRHRISPERVRKSSRPLATRWWTRFNSCRGNTA